MPITGRHSRVGARSCKKRQNLKNNSGGSTARCKRTWDTVPYFGLNGLSMILCLWPPSTPYQVTSNTRTGSKLEGTTLNGRREVSIMPHRPVASSDLKHSVIPMFIFGIQHVVHTFNPESCPRFALNPESRASFCGKSHIPNLISRNPVIPMVIFGIPHLVHTFNSESCYYFAMKSISRMRAYK